MTPSRPLAVLLAVVVLVAALGMGWALAGALRSTPVDVPQPIRLTSDQVTPPAPAQAPAGAAPLGPGPRPAGSDDDDGDDDEGGDDRDGDDDD